MLTDHVIHVNPYRENARMFILVSHFDLHTPVYGPTLTRLGTAAVSGAP